MRREHASVELEEPVELEGRVERVMLEIPLCVAQTLPSGVHALAIEDIVRSCEEPRGEELEGWSEMASSLPYSHCGPCVCEVHDVGPEGGGL